MANDADVGINARMNYTLDDLEESGTFRVQTDPATEEGIVILDRVSRIYFIYYLIYNIYYNLINSYNIYFYIIYSYLNY